MTSVKESRELTVSDLEGVVREYWESVQKTIEIESNKLKERVERDSSQIITEAKEEAKKTVAQARQEAGLESKRIIAEAKEEAKKTVAQARQEAGLESKRIIAEAKEEAEQAAREYLEEAYTEALQESARVIGDTKEKVSQVVTEIIGHIITQAKDDFARAASKASSGLENGTSEILNQLSKSFEEIIGETKTKTKTGFESLPSVITEPETKVEPCTEINDKEGEVSSRQRTRDTITSMTSVCEETDSRIHSVGHKLDAQIEDRDDTRLFKGRLKVELVYPYYKDQTWSMQHELAEVPGLKIISTDSYARGNNQIIAHTIELEQPMPLLKNIKATMHVKDIAEHKGNIVVLAK